MYMLFRKRARSCRRGDRPTDPGKFVNVINNIIKGKLAPHNCFFNATGEVNSS